MSRRSKQEMPDKPRWHILLVTNVTTALVMAGLLWICSGSGPSARGQAPNQQAPAGTQEAPPGSSSEYGKQTVAYIYGSIAITREELGEYLIARCGAEKLDLLVNKRIIEEECRRRNIVVTGMEVENAFADDLKSLQVTKQDFVEKILKNYKKTPYEWKEDVIRPKLLMTKLVKDQVKYTDEELHLAFEAYHGEKINGRIIYWKDPKAKQNVMRIYPNLRDSDDYFNETAKHQENPQLASRAGKLEKPIGHHTTGDDVLERELFGLQPGGVSSVIERPEGIVVFKCDERIPADTTTNFDAVKPALIREVVEKKIRAQIKTTFDKLRENAHPDLLLAGVPKVTNIREDVDRALAPGGPIHRPGDVPPGN